MIKGLGDTKFKIGQGNNPECHKFDMEREIMLTEFSSLGIVPNIIKNLNPPKSNKEMV